MKKKIIYILLAVCILFTSCAENYQYKDEQGKVKTLQPYGWADYQKYKSEDAVYQVNLPNVVLSIVFSETVIVPLWLTGTQLFEPIGLSDTTEKKSLLP